MIIVEILKITIFLLLSYSVGFLFFKSMNKELLKKMLFEKIVIALTFGMIVEIILGFFLATIEKFDLIYFVIINMLIILVLLLNSYLKHDFIFFKKR